MRYVGLTALGIVFWVDVILLRMIVTHECTPAQPAVVERAPVRFAPTALPALPTRTHVIRPYVDEDPRIVDSGPGPLSKAALVAGLNGVRPLIHACYERFQVPGTAMVNVVIARSGRVSSAVVNGKFADTATGDCVAAAVRTARFPQSDGISTPYPFQLK